MWSRRHTGIAFALAWICVAAPGPVLAGDEEGCLFCHSLELRVAGPSADGRDLRVWETPGGSHGALYCSDCHPDAGKAPHAAVPGPAQCIGECHGQTALAKESHRRASYGGLIESHRILASPGAPCRLCHRATDKGGNRGLIVARCAGCHGRIRESVARGVHARIGGAGGAGMCPECHVAHPVAPGGRKASCAGAGCHPSVTVGMRRLALHGGDQARGWAPRRAAEGGIIVGFAALGLLLGRRLSPAGKGVGGRR